MSVQREEKKKKKKARQRDVHNNIFIPPRVAKHEVQSKAVKFPTPQQLDGTDRGMNAISLKLNTQKETTV